MLSSHTRAFTLSETLAVITIVASLAALLFPVFASAKESARGTSCITNLYQIGVATSLYMNDWDDRYPVVVNALERRSPDVWMGRNRADDPAKFETPVDCLGRYAKDQRIFVCPLDYGAAIGYHFRAYPHLYPLNGGTSYLFSELFDGQTPGTWRNPSNAIWACDGSQAWHTPNYNDDLMLPTNRINAVFFDFHAASIRNRNAPTFLEG
ncbi:MAG TPA: type II secretion system protein [Fimbriimonadaceae bacterium]|nr:type II secretion system protein [Fimbriimonadaceae bacterium]